MNICRSEHAARSNYPTCSYFRAILPRYHQSGKAGKIKFSAWYSQPTRRFSIIGRVDLFFVQRALGDRYLYNLLLLIRGNTIYEHCKQMLIFLNICCIVLFNHCYMVYCWTDIFRNMAYRNYCRNGFYNTINFICNFYSESFSIWFTLEIDYNNSSKCIFIDRCRLFLDNMVNGHIIMEGFYEKEVSGSIFDFFHVYLVCSIISISSQ